MGQRKNSREIGYKKRSNGPDIFVPRQDTIKTYVTDLINPEALFMVHGFGRKVKAQTRCYNKGASDTLLQENISDTVGGSPALQHVHVKVQAV